MKKITLLFAFFIACSVAFGQQQRDVVMTDWDGETFSGLVVSYWSYEMSPDTVANPLMEGINTSATVVNYPAHSWYHWSWGWIKGFLNFTEIPSAIINDNKYFVFDALIITDTLSVNDTIDFSMQFSRGETSESYTTETLTSVPIVAGADNVWQTVILEIPDDVTPTDHIWASLLSTNRGFYIDETWTTVNMFIDNVGFANSIVGFENYKSENSMKAFMRDGDLAIQLEESTMVRNAQVYSITGARVIEQNYNSMEKEFSLPVNLEDGIYIVKINTDKGSFTSKFVK